MAMEIEAEREMKRPPRRVTCCGEAVICDRYTNTCHQCGADYNMSGHQLAPRSQWGLETGETANDILLSEAAGFPELE